MKLFVVTIDEVCDYSHMSHTPSVHLTKKAARARLAEERKTARKDYKKVYGEDYAEDCGKDSFECYYDGDEATNHFSVVIDEVEVEGIKKCK